MRKSVSILTLHRSANYGSVLQALVVQGMMCGLCLFECRRALRKRDEDG